MKAAETLRKIADALERGEDWREWGAILEILGREIRRGKVKPK